MQNVDVAHTRNFALIGHAGDGKTTLAEALLHAAKATAAPGSVLEGTSNLDTSPEEKERHHTLATSVYAFDTDGIHVTLVDTPGDPNFQGDGQIAVHALDGALLVVSAVDGCKVGTESMWRATERAGVPVAGFVNGIDRDRSDFEAAVASLKAIGANPVRITLPIGEGPELKGVVDLVAMRAWVDGKSGEIPAELADAAEAARAELVEAVAECDDELLERYLEEGELGEDDVNRGLLAAVRTRALVPVLCGAASSGVGADAALAAVTGILPSPADRPAFADAEGGEVAADPEAPFSARVFKTVIDRYAGKLSILRVVSGTLQENASVVDATTGSKERLGKLLLLKGAEHADVPAAGPGDVVAVAKLKDVHTGDALTLEKGGVALPAIPIPHGVLSYAISAKDKGDEDKVFTSLAPPGGGGPDPPARTRPGHRRVPAHRDGRAPHPHHGCRS